MNIIDLMTYLVFKLFRYTRLPLLSTAQADAVGGGQGPLGVDEGGAADVLAVPAEGDGVREGADVRRETGALDPQGHQEEEQTDGK